MIMAVFGTELATAPQSVSALPLPLSMSGVAVTINGLPAPLYYISPGQINVQVPYEAGAGPAVLGVNNNGQISGIQFQISPSAPGIVTDGNGNVNPTPTAPAGSIGVLYVTGDGVVTPALRDWFFTCFRNGAVQPSSLAAALQRYRRRRPGVPRIRRGHAGSGRTDPGELHVPGSVAPGVAGRGSYSERSAEPASEHHRASVAIGSTFRETLNLDRTHPRRKPDA